LEFGKIGFWREGETEAPREKTIGKEENQQQTYPFTSKKKVPLSVGAFP